MYIKLLLFFFEGVPYQTHHGLEASFSSFYSPKWLGTTGWERSGDKEIIQNMYFYTNSLEVKPRFFKRPVKRPSIFQVRCLSSSRSMKWWHFQDSLAPKSDDKQLACVDLESHGLWATGVRKILSKLARGNDRKCGGFLQFSPIFHVFLAFSGMGWCFHETQKTTVIMFHLPLALKHK